MQQWSTCTQILIASNLDGYDFETPAAIFVSAPLKRIKTEVLKAKERFNHMRQRTCFHHHHKRKEQAESLPSCAATRTAITGRKKSQHIAQLQQILCFALQVFNSAWQRANRKKPARCLQNKQPS